MRNVIENWNGTDADLIVELNRKQFKRTIGTGLVTLPMVAAIDTTLAATLNYTLQQVIASLKVSDPPTGSFVETFYLRLTTSSFGIDLANDALRQQMTQLLSGAGWSQQQINAVLSIGAVLESYADLALGRNAVQADVDQVRATIAREQLQADYTGQFNSLIQPKLQTGTRAEVAAAMRQAANLIEAD